jgi:hypothetical protein
MCQGNQAFHRYAETKTFPKAFSEIQRANSKTQNQNFSLASLAEGPVGK